MGSSLRSSAQIVGRPGTGAAGGGGATAGAGGGRTAAGAGAGGGTTTGTTVTDGAGVPPGRPSDLERPLKREGETPHEPKKQ